MYFFQPTSQQDETGQAEPDTILVTRVQAGDLSAFERLIARHGPRVYRTVVAITGNLQEAQDALQETFLKAFKHICRFEGRSEFSTWLTSIATNTALQRLRDQKRFDPIEDRAGEPHTQCHPRELQAKTADPEQLYSQAERRRLLERGLKKVPSKYRAVLALRDLEQLSTADVGTVLGLRIPAVKARLFRARVMLRAALSPHFDSGVGKEES